MVGASGIASVSTSGFSAGLGARGAFLRVLGFGARRLLPRQASGHGSLAAQCGKFLDGQLADQPDNLLGEVDGELVQAEFEVGGGHLLGYGP